MISVYNARGLLIESVDPVWLYGTASEHSVFYQYNFNKAKNVFAGIIQTESPYYQPAPAPPQPYLNAVSKVSGDPTYGCASGDEFSGCDESWAVIIQGSANIQIGGAGLYSWFSNYAQDCVDSATCQKALILLKNNYAGVRIRNLITIGAKYMWVEDGKGVLAADNQNIKSHPDWSQITAIDFAGNGTALDQMIWIDPSIWAMETPAFSCSAPCVVQLPPWKSATSTVNYPLVTVSNGAWTSTITRPPVTVQEVLWQPITITAGGGQVNRRAIDFSAFFPTPASVPHHSPVSYNGPDGLQTVVTPTAAFPQPPSSIDSDSPPPPTGSWPKRAVQPFNGNDFPQVPECMFDDFSFCSDPWIYGNFSTGGQPDPGLDDDDESPDGGGPEDAYALCINVDPPTKTSSSMSSSTSSTSSIPVPSPMQNTVDCYNSGRKADHARLDSAITSFCNALVSQVREVKQKWMLSLSFPFDLQFGSEAVSLRVDISAEVFDNCDWKTSFDECQRYLEVPLNSCNCGGTNGKQGGYVQNNCLKFRIDPNNNW